MSEAKVHVALHTDSVAAPASHRKRCPHSISVALTQKVLPPHKQTRVRWRCTACTCDAAPLCALPAQLCKTGCVKLDVCTAGASRSICCYLVLLHLGVRV
eukprot:359432-Chlamydomonas_euryale.AAC.6